MPRNVAIANARFLAELEVTRESFGRVTCRSWMFSKPNLERLALIVRSQIDEAPKIRNHGA